LHSHGIACATDLADKFDVLPLRRNRALQYDKKRKNYEGRQKTVLHPARL